MFPVLFICVSVNRLDVQLVAEIYSTLNLKWKCRSTSDTLQTP